VLYDIECAYQIECIVRERQGCHLAQYDLRTAPAKLGKRGRADVDKLSFFERQARSQAGRNLEPPRGFAQQ
jgi:hypothetical protein